MAVERPERPYIQFNFKVDLKDSKLDPGQFSGGFQEVSGLGTEVTVTEYRNGNDLDNGVRKVTGLNKANDITLKRGVIGATTLYSWLNDIRNGNQTVFRDITIHLQDEQHQNVFSWTLRR